MKYAAIATALTLSLTVAGVVSWHTLRPRDPAPELPPPGAFRPGTCRTIAEPVLSLARLAHRAEDRPTVPATDRAELAKAQNVLVSARSGAAKDLADALDGLVVAIGYARLRVDSGTFEPSYLRDVDTARQKLQAACVAWPGGGVEARMRSAASTLGASGRG
ncbi:hypothetical protein [Krasilnikovia sp. M28-CT-15]|uniref:hypothetical protein n=1 Tax=Krasilnikovia sp. M28-CT-15 TaxID=3373540 RepID=UPI003876C2BE